MKRYQYYKNPIDRLTKSPIDRFKEAGYSDQTIANLHYLESHCEHFGDFLEEYRWVQPDGKLFSETSLKIILELHDLGMTIFELENVIENLRQPAEQSKDERVFDENAF